MSDFKYCIVQLLYVMVNPHQMLKCEKCPFNKDCENDYTYMSLKKFAKEIYQQGYADGYAQDKKKNYDCSCFTDYPNESHKKKNGSWKCVDKYEKCEDWVGKYIGSCKTHCRKKEQKNN